MCGRGLRSTSVDCSLTALQGPERGRQGRDNSVAPHLFPVGSDCPELFALRAALERVRDEPSPAPLVACSDSRAALSLLSAGAAAQTSTIGAAIWRTLLDIAERRQVTLQWAPAHCGLAENERADALAKQAATLPQDAVPSDARSLTRAVYRTATQADVPEHVLLRCPALAGARLRLTGSIHVDPSRLRDADLVAALEAGYLRHREPLGYGPP
ncbi:Ribonuclease HI [Amphibalanus amphitrite]|uniref:Ribonuclease HI n=1 Tax=Amphibalanus amphitrite TaxID=1232801 RepID=A0A6A4VJH9_AMPAM|nr:Ribonuclease HI [Amphibalanus amphitrite]